MTKNDDLGERIRRSRVKSLVEVSNEYVLASEWFCNKLFTALFQRPPTEDDKFVIFAFKTAGIEPLRQSLKDKEPVNELGHTYTWLAERFRERQEASPDDNSKDILDGIRLASILRRFLAADGAQERAITQIELDLALKDDPYLRMALDPKYEHPHQTLLRYIETGSSLAELREHHKWLSDMDRERETDRKISELLQTNDPGIMAIFMRDDGLLSASQRHEELARYVNQETPTGEVTQQPLRAAEEKYQSTPRSETVAGLGTDPQTHEPGNVTDEKVELAIKVTTPGAEGGGIFVSYRRQDSGHLAGRLYDRLAERFGEGRVFMDVDTIAPGVDFAEEISRAVAACQVLVAVVGPAWLTATDERGRRRLDDPDDFVRLEIETALARGVRVIPVLAQGAVMPGRDDLPESLADLARRNALFIRHESFRSDAGRLLAAIEQVLVVPPGFGPSPGE